MVETNTRLMKLSRYTTNISLHHSKNFIDFVFRDFENLMFSSNHYNGKCWFILDYLLIWKCSRESILMKLCNYSVCIIKQVWWTLLKNLSSRFKDFRKNNIIQSNPIFAIVVIARKNPILEIAENRINEIFTVQRYKLNTHLVVIWFDLINRVFVSTII